VTQRRGHRAAVVEAAPAPRGGELHLDGHLRVALAVLVAGTRAHLEDGLAPAYSLFSESQGRIVVTCAEPDAEALVALLVSAQVPYSVLGEVAGTSLTIEGLLDVPVTELRGAWEPTLAAAVHGDLQSEELREG